VAATAKVDARSESRTNLDGGGLHYADKYDEELKKVKPIYRASSTRMIAVRGPPVGIGFMLRDTIFQRFSIRLLTYSATAELVPETKKHF